MSSDRILKNDLNISTKITSKFRKISKAKEGFGFVTSLNSPCTGKDTDNE
jgi:hypothetical protein